MTATVFCLKMLMRLWVRAPREPYPLYNAKLPQGRMHACLARCRLGRGDFLARPLLIHRQTSCSANVSKDVAVMFHTRRAPWEAALLVLHRVSLPDLAEQGVVFSLLFSACAGSYFGEGKAPHLDLTSNRALFVRLARLASDWSFSTFWKWARFCLWFVSMW